MSTTSMIIRYRRFFDYEKDAHAKVFASFATVPVENRGSDAYRQAVAWLAHLTAARSLWLGRLGRGPVFDGDFFPANPDLDRVKADWQEVAAQWTNYLAAIDDAEVDRLFEYTSLEGDRYRNRVEDIFTQLFGHSLYHRGHIAQLIKAAGGRPAATDFLFWTREALG